jgi:hypothetical protein
MSSKLMLVLFVSAVLITSIVAASIPAASALTSRASFNDNHYTASRPGGPRICGDHICAPGEFDQMQQALSKAQMKGKTGTTAPTTPTPPTTTPTPPTTTPAMNGTSTTTPAMNGTSTTMSAMSVCPTVKGTLINAGVPSAVIAKVMADLGCS